jgi:hypothetical protein
MKGASVMSSQTMQTTAKQFTQGEAVVQAVRDVLKSDYREGVKVILSEEQRKAVTELLVKGFAERRIPLKPSPANEAKLADPKKLGAYVKGLLNNWLTKSSALNGKPKKAKAAASAPTMDSKPPVAAAPSTSAETAQEPRAEQKVVASPIAKKPMSPFGKK